MAIVTKLPDVTKVEGLILDKSGIPQNSKVTLQYSDHNNTWYETEYPLIEALRMLNFLEKMSREQGFDLLRQSLIE